MSTNVLVPDRQKAVAPVQAGELTVDQIYHLKDQIGSQNVVVVQKGKPWGWIISGTLVALFMVMSFLYAVMTEMTKAAERSADRAHEMALDSAEKAHQVTLESVRALETAAQKTSSAGFLGNDPGIAIVFIVGLIGVGFVARGMCKVILR